MPSAFAPGRVNLIGDHTDYTGGLVLPLAVQLGTTVRVTPGGSTLVLDSDTEPEPAVVPLDLLDPTRLEPVWARYVGGVVAELHPVVGGVGTVTTTLPVGAGLSSSAALELAVALALGAPTEPLELARMCQRAEQRASGVPCGIMDQLTSAAGVAGHALLIDCTTLAIDPVPIPEDLEIHVVHSGVFRSLSASAYAERRAQCEAAAAVIGPLREATETAVATLGDPLLGRRARHVVTENHRVAAAAAALRVGDGPQLGALMQASHTSLATDFEVSCPELDDLVARLSASPGVLGARLTGAGFGGCAVAVAEPGARLDVGDRRHWVVRAADGARRLAP